MTIHDEPAPGLTWPIRTIPHANGHTPTQRDHTDDTPTVYPAQGRPVDTAHSEDTGQEQYAGVFPEVAEATGQALGVGGKRSFADKLGNGFYAAAATTAVVGQAWAAAKAVPFPEHTAEALKVAAVTPGVVVTELGGMASAALADARMRMGEKAYGYRALSAASAAGAIGLQVAGHADQPVLAGAFAGISGFGYGLYLLRSAAERRDALRAAGKLTETAPSYGVKQWFTAPGITRRARALAVEHGLSVTDSLAAAREEKRVGERRAAIGSVIKQVMEAEHGDPLRAKIATTTYDLDKLAERIEARTDYDGWAATISGALTPPAPVDDALAAEQVPVLAATSVRLDQLDDEASAPSEKHDQAEHATDRADHDQQDQVEQDQVDAASTAVEPVWTVETATTAAQLMLAAGDVEALSQLYGLAAAGDPVARAALDHAAVWDSLDDADRAAMVGLAVQAAAEHTVEDPGDADGSSTDLKESATDLKDSVTDAEGNADAAEALRRERAAALASRIREQEGRLPTGSELAEAAGVARSTANYAMKPLREQAGADAVTAAGDAVASLRITRGAARERRSSETDQESAADAYRGQQALWSAADQEHEHAAGEAMDA